MSSDTTELDVLAEALRKTMTDHTGAALDAALDGMDWRDMLTELPYETVPLVFRLLGETGAHASVLNDVVLHEAGRPLGDSVPLPYAGGSQVVWERGTDLTPADALDQELPWRLTPTGTDVPPLAAGRRALAWWLTGTARAMLALARQHAVDRTQFGRPIASFQAVRHRLAETLIAIEGAQAALTVADDDRGDLSSLLAKAAAGRAALTAARHCQQVLGGIGFTAEHALHRHVRRAYALDGLLGSTRELTREAGARIRSEGRATRIAQL
ncbi:acyl-CoA dehydrogenase family protein [Streptomyces sp. NPDC102405]|uniref:acyl-CoA dehydrogenase family protein n=1 Tax=Streptomyces sp. NPDC102405 TaxID=3366170 RepID=UPI0037FB841D